MEMGRGAGCLHPAARDCVFDGDTSGLWAARPTNPMHLLYIAIEFIIK